MRRVVPRVLALALPHWRPLAVGMLALFGASGINLLFPALIRVVLNGTWGLSLERDLVPMGLSLAALVSAQSLLVFIRHISFANAGQRIARQLRGDLHAALLRQDIAYFDRSRVGDLLSRLGSDVEVVQRTVTANISVLLRHTVQALGGLVLMCAISGRLALIVFVLVPVFVGCGRIWGRKLRLLAREVQRALGEANVVAEEGLAAIRTVRAFNGAAHERERFGEATKRAEATALRRIRQAALMNGALSFVLNGSIVFAIVLGGSLVARGEMQPGDLAAFLLYAAIVAMSATMLAGAWDDLTQGAGAADRVFDILDKEPEVEAVLGSGVTADAGVPRDLELRSVSFRYPSRPDALALDGVTFAVPAGSTLALVGPSGAGKSTIASLVSRFYDPSEGEIRYAGLSLREWDLQAFRSEIAVVQQQPQVFSLSIGENIRFGRLDAADDEIREVAVAASLDAFIMSLPRGYDTPVGDKGVLLSGGERQRLAIARALLRNPRLLILDEATSALDSENERLVQAALERLKAGRTTLVIAHRLSTVQHADQVVVLESGRICERGTHTELMQLGGLYASYVRHQMLA